MTDHHNKTPLHEMIGWRGSLLFLAGLFLFGGLSFALFGDSKGAVAGAGIPTMIWLGILMFVLDEDGNYDPPDWTGDLPSEGEIDAVEATEEDSPSADDDDLPPVDEEVDW